MNSYYIILSFVRPFVVLFPLTHDKFLLIWNYRREPILRIDYSCVPKRKMKKKKIEIYAINSLYCERIIVIHKQNDVNFTSFLKMFRCSVIHICAFCLVSNYEVNIYLHSFSLFSLSLPSNVSFNFNLLNFVSLPVNVFIQNYVYAPFLCSFIPFHSKKYELSRCHKSFWHAVHSK